MKYLNLIRNVSNWWLYLQLKLGLGKADPLQFTLRPVPIRISVARAMKPLFNEIFVKQVYEPAFQQMQTEQPTILDVGGNMGYFALFSFLRKPAATVYSFEPVPRNFSFLKENKKAHPAFNWTLYNSAVSAESGTQDFYYDDQFSPEGVDVSASLFSADKLATVSARHKRIPVSVLNLEDWMEQQGIDACDLLKLDCEGAEYGILYSMSATCLEKIKYIVADVHRMSGAKENIKDLSDFLRTQGFQVETINEELLYAQRIGA